MKRLLLIGLCAWWVSIGEASAQLDALTIEDCRQTPDGYVVPGDVVAIALASQRRAVPLRAAMSLGDSALEAARLCDDPDTCSQPAYIKRLRELYDETRYLVIDQALPENADFQMERLQSIRRSDEGWINARVRDVLNGETGHIVVRCRRAPAPPNPNVASETQSFFSGLVVGRTSEDAGRALADREFATFSVENDRAADRETISIDLFIGWDSPLWWRGRGYEGQFVPFVGLQRTEIDQTASATGERNDLTFGITLPVAFYRSGGGIASTLNAAVEWETDTDFDSSMTTARFSWAPQIRGTCFDWHTRWSTQSPWTCSVAVVADYSDVGDPGEKVKLAEVDQYARLGLDVSFAYDYELSGGSVLQAGASYSLREPVSDDDGEADLISLNLLLLPSDESHFSFGIEYRHGEDLSSFEAQETTLFRVGYRQ